MRYIGFSLSLCVKSIINGNRRVEDVAHIFTGTKSTHSSWSTLLDQYCETYWREDPTQARAIANQLLHSGRITEPRVYGLNPILMPNITWIDLQHVASELHQ